MQSSSLPTERHMPPTVGMYVFKMNSGFDQLNNALETLATFLGESAVRYEQTEEKIRQGLEK